MSKKSLIWTIFQLGPSIGFFQRTIFCHSIIKLSLSFSLIASLSLQMSFLSHPFHEWKNELLCQLSLILPVCFSFIFRKSIDLVSVIFVGHLGAQYLAASGLATVTANVTGNSMVIGFAGALSTQCSQLFSTKNELAINTVLPRAILIVCCVVTLPVSILWLQSRSILEGLGQSELLAINAGYFLVWLIPGIWSFTFSMCIQNWLHAQSKTKLVLLVTIVTALLHPCFCYLLIYTWNFGYIGAAIASSVSKTLELCLLSLCVYFFSNFRMVWSWALLRDWVAFLKLGVPGLMMMTEWWASEIIIFLSGFLTNPDAKVSAMAIYQNTLSICFMVPSAIHAISITQVGNALGANLPSNAHLSATVAPFLAFLVSAIISLSLFFVQTPWVKLFTDDREVITLLRGIFPVLVVYTVADGVQSALTGILKGLGKQKIAGPIVIFSYYIVGLPFSVFLAFHISGIGADLDLFGLVVGTVIGTYTHMLLFAIVVYRTDWKYEAYYVHGKSKLVVLYTEVSHQLAMARKKMIGQISSSIMFTSTGDSENNDDFDYQDRFAATVSLLHSSHDGAEYKSLGQTVNNEHDSDSGNNNTTSSMGISSISDRKQLVSSSISTSSNTNNNEYLHRGKDLLEHGIDYHTLRYAEDEKLSDEVGITNPLHRERILVAQQHTVNEIDSKDDCGYSDINTSIPGHNLIPASNHPYINTSRSTSSSKQVSVIIDDEALSSKMTYFQLRQLEQRQVELRREIDQDNDNDLWALLMDSLGIYEVIVYLRYRLHGQSASEYHHTTGRGSSSSGGTGYDYAFDPSAGDESNQEPGSLYRLSRVSSRVKPLVAGLERSNSSKSSSVSQGSTELRALQQEHSSYIVRAAQYALSGLTTLVQGSRGTGRTEYELVRNYTDTFTLQDMEDDDENNDTNNNDYEDESK